MNGVRIDKWMWAARFFKTRMLAAKACELGRIVSNGVPAKASREVRVGDSLTIRCESGTYTGEVLGLSEARGSAAVAAELFRETDESRAARAQVLAERKADPLSEPLRPGKPTKRDRRLIHSFRGDS